MLEPEVVISGLRGEPPSEYLPTLERVLQVAQQRLRTGWAGDPTTVVLVPSSEVLQSSEVRDLVQVLARIGRATGITLRLLDVLPPLPSRFGDLDGDAPIPSLAACGSLALRAFVADPQSPHVTWHQVSPHEISLMAEQEH